MGAIKNAVVNGWVATKNAVVDGFRAIINGTEGEQAAFIISLIISGFFFALVAVIAF